MNDYQDGDKATILKKKERQVHYLQNNGDKVHLSIC